MKQVKLYLRNYKSGEKWKHVITIEEPWGFVRLTATQRPQPAIEKLCRAISTAFSCPVKIKGMEMKNNIIEEF